MSGFQQGMKFDSHGIANGILARPNGRVRGWIFGRLLIIWDTPRANKRDARQVIEDAYLACAQDGSKAGMQVIQDFIDSEVHPA